MAVNLRAAILPDVREFARVYVEAFVEYLEKIQAEYRRRKRAFDHLFKHRHRDPAGNFAYRWECILSRLDWPMPPRWASASKPIFILAISAGFT